MEFLELIERVRPESASPNRLYGGLGTNRQAHRRRMPEYQQRFVEALQLVERVAQGDRYATLTFEEAMSTSDFPLLFGDVIDRMMVGAYREFPSGVADFVKEATVRDFRNVSRHAVDGAEAVLPRVNESGEYTETSVSEQEDEYAVDKFGRVLPITWETLVNDDLDGFRDLPLRHGRAARRSEVKFVTELYVDVNGPHASLYTAGNNNIINTTNGAEATNPELSVAGLQDGFTVLSQQTDTDGEPIFIDAVTLVVPPQLEVTARNILNSTELRPKTSGGATSAQELITQNWMRGRLKLVVDPYIPIVASTANGGTSWFLFADPSTSRPALEIGKLRGHTEPEIWVKSPNAMRVGGGTVGPEEGDFEHDEIRYRVRHVFGGTRLTNTGGFRSTVASNGSGA